MQLPQQVIHKQAGCMSDWAVTHVTHTPHHVTAATCNSSQSFLEIIPLEQQSKQHVRYHDAHNRRKIFPLILAAVWLLPAGLCTLVAVPQPIPQHASHCRHHQCNLSHSAHVLKLWLEWVIIIIINPYKPYLSASATAPHPLGRRKAD
jgi:hypothetical protein